VNESRLALGDDEWIHAIGPPNGVISTAESRGSLYLSAKRPRLAYRLDMVEIEANHSHQRCQILFREFLQFY
jgi:hypothetical protein